MATIKAFLDQNYLNDRNIYPDEKYVALRLGLKDYFSTYHTLRGNFYEYLHKTHNPPVSLSNAWGHEYISYYFSSVSFIHLFFELYIKELLEAVEPLFISGKLENKEEKKFIDLIKVSDLTKFTSIPGRTIAYSLALTRLEKLIANDSNIPAQYRIPGKYHFIKDHIDVMREFAEIRNKIIHSASGVLNKYAFELLYVNEIIPLATKLFRIEKSHPYIERKVYCGVNILDELCKLKLDVDYNDHAKVEPLRKTLRHINHLKELGRASYNNHLYMGEEMTQEQMDHLEASHNAPEREEAMSSAVHKVERGHYQIHQCPCCGTWSLTTYEYWTTLKNQKTHVEKSRCSLCTYDVHKELGEPSEFGLMDTLLFVIVEEEAE